MTSSILWKLFLTFIVISFGSFMVIVCFENRYLSEKWNRILETASGIALIVGFIVLIFAVWFTNMS